MNIGSQLARKISGRVQSALADNPLARHHHRRKRREILRREFLESGAYENLFLTRFPDPLRFHEFIHDAQDETPNFRFRHYRKGRILGSWRWKGVFKHRSRIIPIVFHPEKLGIDFGGAAGPISLHSRIVDFANRDVFGREVELRTCSDLDFRPDYIFSSHTLEHLDDPAEALGQFRESLPDGGDLILNLPSFSCVRWRSGVHSHRKYSDHKWTFFLEGTEIEESIPGLLAIDTLVADYFDIYLKEYTGDDSIVILAKR
jgi:hypothetical protein